MKVSQLMRIAHFMSLEPITGFNIINNILKVVKLEIPLSAPGINIITKMILTRELNMYFARIRKEDVDLSFEALDKFTEEEIDAICFKRGIAIDG